MSLKNFSLLFLVLVLKKKQQNVKHYFRKNKCFECNGKPISTKHPPRVSWCAHLSTRTGCERLFHRPVSQKSAGILPLITCASEIIVKSCLLAMSKASLIFRLCVITLVAKRVCEFQQHPEKSPKKWMSAGGEFATGGATPPSAQSHVLPDE